MYMNITEDQLEGLARLAGVADNYYAASGMQLPPEMHIECLRTGMAAISEQIKKLYVETTGENPWKK